jgi:hypothetical protein
MPRPDKAAIEAAEKEAVKNLTTLQKPPTRTFKEQVKRKFLNLTWAEAESLEEKKSTLSELDNRVTVTQMSDAIKRVVLELFRDVEYTTEDRMRVFSPSTNANYNRSKSEKGAFGEIMEREDLFDDLNQKPLFVEFNEESVDLQGLKRLFEGESLEELKSNNLRGQEGKTIEMKENVSERYRKVYNRMLDEAMVEKPFVEPVGLAESLKVRVISKGPPLTYTVLKPLQKKLHSTLRRHKLFRLIGEPVTEEIVNEELPPKDGTCYLSGDYSAATDKLAPWASEVAADAISDCLQLTEQERTLFKRALTQHIFVSDDEKEIPQRWGQLMGSIISFPVLCIINAAVLLVTNEVIRGRNLKLKHLKGFINGDDLLTQLPDYDPYRIVWERVAECVGFIPSIGKYYWHPNALNVNSTNFYVTNGQIKLARYVNLGLLFGLKRSGGRRSVLEDDAYADMGSVGTELMNSCPVDLRIPVYKKFLKENKSRLEVKAKGGTLRLPYFLPKWLGGIGLPFMMVMKDGSTLLGKELLKRISVFRKQVDEVTKVFVDAGGVINELELEKLRNSIVDTDMTVSEVIGPFLPSKLDQRCALAILLLGKKVQKRPPTASWKLWKIIKDQIPETHQLVPTRLENDNWGKMISIMTWFNIFTNRLENLFSASAIEEDVRKNFQVLKSNARLYQPDKTRLVGGAKLDLIKVLDSSNWQDMLAITSVGEIAYSS